MHGKGCIYIVNFITSTAYFLYRRKKNGFVIINGYCEFFYTHVNIIKALVSLCFLAWYAA